MTGEQPSVPGRRRSVTRPQRSDAERLAPSQLKEFPGAHHDILNETVHREVAAADVEFIDKQAGPHGEPWSTPAAPSRVTSC
jgi:alpha-beta hydrolase superfamily lysophospholipase